METANRQAEKRSAGTAHFSQHLTRWGGESMVLLQSMRVLTADCTGLFPWDTARHILQTSSR